MSLHEVKKGLELAKSKPKKIYKRKKKLKNPKVGIAASHLKALLWGL